MSVQALAHAILRGPDTQAQVALMLNGDNVRGSISRACFMGGSL